MNKGTAIVGFLLCFIAGMGLMYSVDRSAGRTASITAEAYADGEPWSDDEGFPAVSSKDPMWGSRTAPVTMVVFSDFECPFCARVETTITQLKEKYGADKLRILWKSNPLPFHKNARPASVAAETVFRLGGSKAFWKFHGRAFENFKGGLTPENFEAWAAEAGVDRAKFKAAYDKQEFASKIDADMAIGKTAGVTGTPAAFINGVFLSGAQPIDKFSAVIDEQLKAAQTAAASGTKPDKVYVKVSQENKAKAPPPKERQQKPEQDDTTVWKVPVGDSPAKGPETALVTIVEWSDFQCPFCGKVVPTLDEIIKTYGDKVRFVWKDNPLPFHQRAEPAAELAREARAQKGDKGFWAAYDLLWKNNQKLSDEDLLGYAKELGLDVDKVKVAIAEKKYGASIQADQDLADDLQASGTPHFFINGRRLVGAQPLEKFKALIDEEMKKSEALLAKGVSPKDLYNQIIKDGKTPPPPERKEVAAPGPSNAWKGGDKAKVVMQVFSDFECPFCKRVEDTVTQVEKTYGDKIKIVWRHRPLPMHKNAPLASEAAQEAFAQKGNAGFWAYHGLLFKNAGAGPDVLARPALEKYAEEAGLDLAKFKAALDGNTQKAVVDADNAVAEKAGISGTPAFVINGYFISGAQPFSKFKKIIDTALREAGDAPPKGGAVKLEAPKKPLAPKPSQGDGAY
ncbi:DsbA family protein [Chondromyces crocatus]|uniref:DSBA oxidoreductase n=1 Tax=Chondromyces crocatus TaxID=52 RepID=A0A0K1EKR4_CHOCO|nr:thioredoxin domain-containing protein [Chondromyces crocatus]AKT41426.1 DSBA oxidoreductase [Chondromyces crocatus]